MNYENTQTGQDFYLAVAQAAMITSRDGKRNHQEEPASHINAGVQKVADFFDSLEGEKCPSCDKSCILAGSVSPDERVERILGNFLYFALMFAATASKAPESLALFSATALETIAKGMEKRKEGFDA